MNENVIVNRTIVCTYLEKLSLFKIKWFFEFIIIDNLFTKLEFLNPTGSFKDRGSQIMLSVISENKIDELYFNQRGRWQRTGDLKSGIWNL